MVDQPEFVSINTLVADGGATFTIQSHPDDTGKLIGKQGRNAQSIRIIFSAIGMKLHRRYVIASPVSPWSRVGSLGVPPTDRVLTEFLFLGLKQAQPSLGLCPIMLVS